LKELKDGTDGEYGRWGLLFNDKSRKGPLRMTSQTARAYIKIVNNEALTNATHALDLPASWYVLYLLSDIASDRLNELIAEGSVHPGLQRIDAEALVQRECSRIRIRRKRGRPTSRKPDRELFRRKRVRPEPGPVEDILRDLKELTYRASPLFFELQERAEEVQADRDIRNEVREIADELTRNLDRVLAIVRDDPGAVLGGGVLIDFDEEMNGDSNEPLPTCGATQAC
jgi:hypothetical protein